MKRLLIVSDAWEPQTNGVVTTLRSVIAHLPDHGMDVQVIHPGLFDTVPLPGYREIRVARNPGRLAGMMTAYGADTVHIATEGPLGLWARNLLCRRGTPFTTSLHTKFPEYLHERLAVPVSLGYGYLRWFHRPAAAVLCTTESHRQELANRGFTNLRVWGRGVDTRRFCPASRPEAVRPRLVYVGRVAVEKNVEAFLELDVPGDKCVVGDGPARKALQRRYPSAAWLGYRHGAELVAEYARADVLVFPSRTDTFGLVMLEAMACGTPVAAFPVTGPRDVVTPGVTGSLHEDLAVAVRQALTVDRRGCRAHAETQDWHQVTAQLVIHLASMLPASARDPEKLAA